MTRGLLGDPGAELSPTPPRRTACGRFESGGSPPLVMTYASCYSGIGGADAGFATAGWRVLWQAEADAYRRRVLARRWPDARQLPDVPCAASVACPDAIYAELPSQDLARWWPPLWALGAALRPAWLVVEFSPAVPFELPIRDLALGGWAFRALQVGILIRASGRPEAEWVARQRMFLAASPSHETVAALRVRGHRIEIDIGITADGAEAALGLPAGWTCACDAAPCACVASLRARALEEATPPHLTYWIARTLEGWSSEDGYPQ